jgi:dephospho-CoA kinase
MVLLYTLHFTLCTGAEGFPMRVIAITGGIGSGKSTVRRLFEELGAAGIDADELARQVVLPGSEGARHLAEIFGQAFFDREGRLDRKKMAEKVFAEPDARLTLERILHPLIRSAENNLIQEIRTHDPEKVVVVEIPLLVEGGRATDYDGVVLVRAPEIVRSTRLVHSGKYSQDEAASRMSSQADDRDRVAEATWIVDNSGDLDSTAEQVRKIYESLISA